MIPGKLVSLSRDRLMDEATKQPYYLGIIEVEDSALPLEYQGKTIAGLTVEVIIPTRERTALDYLIEPLQMRMRTVFREK